MAELEQFKTNLRLAVSDFVAKLYTFESLPAASSNRTTRTDSINCFELMETSLKENREVEFATNETFHQAFLAGKLPHQVEPEYRAAKRVVDEFRANHADIDLAPLIDDVCHDFYNEHNNNNNNNNNYNYGGGRRGTRRTRSTRRGRSTRRSTRRTRSTRRSARRSTRSTRRSRHH